MPLRIGGGDDGLNGLRIGFGAWDCDVRADTGALPGLHHRPPIIGAIFFQQQDLKRAASFGVAAAKSRAQHARVVKHQHVSRTQIAFKFGELAMFMTGRITMQHEQARLVTLRRRMLRNQFRGQFVVEFARSHAQRLMRETGLPISEFEPATERFRRRRLGRQLLGV